MPNANRPAVLDAVIFGGGASGLWLLDELTHRGYDVLLLESGDLGSGQTITSQGIIHGGLKYSLSGLLTPPARAIREMPGRWRRCLAGEERPNLSRTRLRSEFCHVWRTARLTSRLAMAGAKVGLRVAPVTVEPEGRPDVLAACPGEVARLDEQVIEPSSFLGDLADQHRPRLLHIDVEHGLEIHAPSAGSVDLVRLINPETGDSLDLRPDRVIFTAGAGNAALREMAGLPSGAMQRRPLHMVMARGAALPWLNGHCVDGGATRVTITSTGDCRDRVVWQVGGLISERGTEMDRRELIERARSELREVLPGFDPDLVEWGTYRIDRAEGKTVTGRRPDAPSMLCTGNTITAWPSKLALAPELSRCIRERLDAPATGRPASAEMESISRWPRPVVALPPWELDDPWS